MLYGVVLGEVIKVDGQSFAAEEDSGDGQEISQRFRKMINLLDRMNESADCEVFAVVVADISESVWWKGS